VRNAEQGIHHSSFGIPHSSFSIQHSNMSKNLVIVESPAKARTINKILGKDFTVRASMGHVRDLPERDLGVDIENGFKPKYVAIKTRAKVLQELREAAEHAERIYLAPDPDREGEAIAWHLMAALGGKAGDQRFCRVSYNEITAPAIRKAFAQPREIDQNRVDSQQARRILDRIVGYKVSPLLWRRIRGAASAGRVQSVALRLVCEREREIRGFKPEEYWILGAKVRKLIDPRDPFGIRLARVNGEKADIGSADRAHAVRADLEGRRLVVSAIIRREIFKKPPPAFITSTLQQAASRVFGFTPSRTMKIAQKLYEGVDTGSGAVGLITYMRTDSFAISDTARDACRAFVAKAFGDDFVPEKAHVYKSRSGAQEAHEAIRPTDVEKTPDAVASVLDTDELKLYGLIWQRFVASQMAAARIAQRTAEVDAPPPEGKTSTYLFRASTSEVLFPGYMRVTGVEEEKKAKEELPVAPGEEEELVSLPPLEEGESLENLEWLEERKETMPPPRFTEASLIRALEENGVGRPSTYAQTVSTILDRKYVDKDKRALVPTEMGLSVNDYLVQHLASLFDVKFTAGMEASLDEVENGNVKWTAMLGEFYRSFAEWLIAAKGPPAPPETVRRILDLLVQVRQWAPERKQGKRTYSDEKFVVSVREQLDEGKPISDRQLEALVRVATAYREQVEGLDAALREMGFAEALLRHAEAALPPSPETLRKMELLKPLAFEEARQVRGKTYDDRVFFESLRSQAEGGKRLSERQIHHLDRLLIKYSDQIPGFEEMRGALGITDAQALGDPLLGSVVELTGHIKTWNPPVEKGKRIWDDEKFCGSLRQQFTTKKSLSPRQVAALKRLLRKYAAQIPGYDELIGRLGLMPRSRKAQAGDAAGVTADPGPGT
jgi:DNA topoisomerase I